MGNCVRQCLSTQIRRDSDLDLIPDSDQQEVTDSLSQNNSESSGGRPSFHIGHDRRANFIPVPTSAPPLAAGSTAAAAAAPPLYYLAPGVGRRVDQLSEEEQIRIAKRIGLITHLPVHVFSDSEKEKQWECIICMIEYNSGDTIRCLPCTHAYHKECIDDWLMRSFTCPTCNQPVDSALITTFTPPSA